MPGEYIHWGVSALKISRESLPWLVESLPCLRRSQLANAIANLQEHLFTAEHDSANININCANNIEIDMLITNSLTMKTPAVKISN